MSDDTRRGGTTAVQERVDGEVEGYAVTWRPPTGEPVSFLDVTAEAAYARALLSLLELTL